MTFKPNRTKGTGKLWDVARLAFRSPGRWKPKSLVALEQQTQHATTMILCYHATTATTNNSRYLHKKHWSPYQELQKKIASNVPYSASPGSSGISPCCSSRIPTSRSAATTSPQRRFPGVTPCCTWKNSCLGDHLPFWEGLFIGAMLVVGKVHHMITYELSINHEFYMFRGEKIIHSSYKRRHRFIIS